MDTCKKIGGLYYCEIVLLLKHINEHTCASAIYHNRSDIVPKLCTVKYLEGYRPKPRIIESSSYIMMIAMPTPWNIYCNRALDISVSLKENPLVMIHRQDPCHCAFSAGPYYINENLIACENQKRKLTSKIGIYYTVNTIMADFFYKTMAEINNTKDKLMIELDSSLI